MTASRRFCVVAALLVAAPAMAQPRPGAGRAPHGAPVHPAPGVVRPAPPGTVHPGPPRAVHPAPPRGPLRLDDRYHHDHYYPAPGFTFGALPTGSVGIAWRGGTWFFHGGVWFRP
ncbi:MAG: hypothetical protein ACXWC6_17840, partial [Ramlibacter sp.]